MTIISMQTMRYINLLDKTSRVKTRKCFVYNNIIFFAVPKNKISWAIGRNFENVKKIQEKLRRKIRIICEAQGINDAEKFILDIVSPIRFKSLEVKDNTLFITAGGRQNKAALIGREKRRLIELAKIVKDIFGLDVRII